MIHTFVSADNYEQCFIYFMILVPDFSTLKLFKIKQIFYLLVFSLISISSMGAVVDFSGKWNLNKAKSTLNDQFSMTPNQLILTQNNDGLAVEKHGSFQDKDYTISDKFTLDG